jgi:hypothetical protein
VFAERGQITGKPEVIPSQKFGFGEVGNFHVRACRSPPDDGLTARKGTLAARSPGVWRVESRAYRRGLLMLVVLSFPLSLIVNQR